MKILFVGNTSWSMWNFRKEVMLALKELGYEIIVVAPRDEQTKCLREHFSYEPLKSLSRKGRNPFQDFKLIVELYKIYRKHQPKHIFQYTIKPNLYGSIAALFSGHRPFSVVAGMGYLFTNYSLITAIVSLMYRVACAVSRKILFLNPDDVADFKKLRILPSKSDKILLLPGEGVNLEHFSSARNAMYKQVGDAIFVFVGRLLIEKGIREYLKAAKKIREKYPKVIFRVVGSIDSGNPGAISEAELLAFIADGSVQYSGPVNDVRPFLADADALVLPTLYGEGLSRVCLEAFAMKRPVISTNNRGVKALVRDGISGLCIPQEQVHLLAEVLERFLELKPNQRAELGENGYRIVKDQYSISEVISCYKALCGSDT